MSELNPYDLSGMRKAAKEHSARRVAGDTMKTENDGAGVPLVNTCPVCRPYAKKGYQELSDGRTVPCYACNRAEFVKQAVAERGEVGSAPHCHADSDGECTWDGCPQLRDGEPKKSGRHCPYDVEVVSTDNHFEMPKGLSFNVELSPEVAAQVSGVDGGARPDPAVADEILATAKRRLAALVGESSSILPMISRVEAAFKRFGGYGWGSAGAGTK
jgi:hypothetical protein